MSEQTDALTGSMGSIGAMLTRSKAQPASFLDTCPVQILEKTGAIFRDTALFVYWFTHLFFYDFFFFFNSFSIRPRQHQRIVKCSSCYIHSTVTHPANAHDGFSCVSASACITGKLRYSRDTFVWLDIRWQCDTDVAFLLPLCRTRNSADADKPRDALVQMQWRGWPPESTPSPYVLPGLIWSFCVKGCRHNYRRTPKIWEPWNSAVTGWVAWLTTRYSPSPTHQIWYFCVKGCTHK